jgi:Domain of unknown function (DUF2017)
MGFEGRRVVAREGGFLLLLPEGERELMLQLLGELRTLLKLGSEDPRLRRLYPAAYSDDEEKDAEYRRLTHEELSSGRLAAIAVAERTIAEDELTPDQLTAWMHAVNALRLVLGTMLDVNEDDPFAVDPDDPNAREYMLYGYLGLLLEEIVQAQLDG